MIRRICVFCGSSEGNDPIFKDYATKMGKLIAERNLELVYGGAAVGLMGTIADAALAAGGKVYGVLPDFLETKEIAHRGLSKLFLVKSMHERKKIMDELSDAVIALPGGFGTLEELYEMLTWAQLGLHEKPIGILNVKKYYQPLIEMTDHMVQFGLLKSVHRQMMLVSNEPASLLDMMMQYTPPEVDKWLSRENL